MTASFRARDACPSWCQLSGPAAHAGPAGGITHRRVVGEIRLAGVEASRDVAARPVTVALEAYTDPEGQQHAPTVRLALSNAAVGGEPDADDLTLAEARVLADALLETVRLAES